MQRVRYTTTDNRYHNEVGNSRINRRGQTTLRKRKDIKTECTNLVGLYAGDVGEYAGEVGE